MYDVLHLAAYRAGLFVKKSFRTRVPVEYKSNPRDFVTQVDRSSQSIIVEEIQRGMKRRGVSPDKLGFIGEENLSSGINKNTFIIDPLDGTSGYIQGLDYFCISIAYAQSGTITHGLVYDPMRDISYYGQIGKGTYKAHGDKKTLLKIEKRDLSESFLALNSGSDPKTAEKVFSITHSLLPHICKFRSLGSCALSLSYCADNVFQLFLNLQCKLWDIAAAGLIVQEAGGSLIDLEGNEVMCDLEKPQRKYEVIAGEKGLIQSFLEKASA